MIQLFKYLKKKEWLAIITVILLIILQVWLELKIPDYTNNLTVMVQTKSAKMSEVWKNGGLMLACALGSMIAAIACGFLISRVAASFARTLKEKLFEKITSFSNAEMNQFSTPSLITRTTNDVGNMQTFMAMGILMLFKAPILAIWALFKISETDSRWTLVTAICVGIIVVTVSILIALCLPRFKKIQKLTDRLNDVTRENISGVRVVRAFNAQDYQEEKFEKVNKEITKTNLFTSKAMGFMNPLMTICMNGLMLAIYWVAAILINEIRIDAYGGNLYEFMMDRTAVIGNMAAFTQYALQVVMAFMMLIMIFIILPRTLVSGKRIKEVLKTKLSITDGNITDVNDKKGEIEFKNVTFSYSQTSQEVISDISFKVNKGETLAIIGATGSGKTTIINLLPRFYDVTKGEVLIDGINVKEYPEHELRSKIAIASQKAALFKGTIKENITFGTDVINEEKIKEVIEISQSNFINELENGLESEVAQGGTNFSGGQKQRLSIARTLYKDAEIMIFDDTFSALDYKTDMLVRKGIKAHLNDITVIIVAQRIGTIMNADKIIVLDEGKIVGIGRHTELLESCSVYKEIALSQLSKEEL